MTVYVLDTLLLVLGLLHVVVSASTRDIDVEHAEDKPYEDREEKTCCDADNYKAGYGSVDGSLLLARQNRYRRDIHCIMGYLIVEALC